MKPQHERPRTEPVDRVDFEPPARGPARSDEDHSEPIDAEASADLDPGSEEAGYGYGV
jgi:hypothetical protein